MHNSEMFSVFTTVTVITDDCNDTCTDFENFIAFADKRSLYNLGKSLRIM